MSNIAHDVVCEHRRKAGALLIEGKLRPLLFADYTGIVIGLDVQAVGVGQIDDAPADGYRDGLFQQRLLIFTVIYQIAIDCDDQSVRI